MHLLRKKEERKKEEFISTRPVGFAAGKNMFILVYVIARDGEPPSERPFRSVPQISSPWERPVRSVPQISGQTDRRSDPPFRSSDTGTICQVVVGNLEIMLKRTNLLSIVSPL